MDYINDNSNLISPNYFHLFTEFGFIYPSQFNIRKGLYVKSDKYLCYNNDIIYSSYINDNNFNKFKDSERIIPLNKENYISNYTCLYYLEETFTKRNNNQFEEHLYDEILHILDLLLNSYKSKDKYDIFSLMDYINDLNNISNDIKLYFKNSIFFINRLEN